MDKSEWPRDGCHFGRAARLVWAERACAGLHLSSFLGSCSGTVGTRVQTPNTHVWPPKDSEISDRNLLSCPKPSPKPTTTPVLSHYPQTSTDSIEKVAAFVENQGLKLQYSLASWTHPYISPTHIAHPSLSTSRGCLPRGHPAARTASAPHPPRVPHTGKRGKSWKYESRIGSEVGTGGRARWPVVCVACPRA